MDTTTQTTVPAATTKVKPGQRFDEHGESLRLLCNHGWVAEWDAANAELTGKVELLFGLIVLPTGGNEYRPAPRFLKVESLRSKRLFVRKNGKKMTFVEIDKDKNSFDWTAGTVLCPVTVLKDAVGAFGQPLRKAKAPKGETPPPAGEPRTDPTPAEIAAAAAAIRAEKGDTAPTGELKDGYDQLGQTLAAAAEDQYAAKVEAQTSEDAVSAAATATAESEPLYVVASVNAKGKNKYRPVLEGEATGDLPVYRRVQHGKGYKYEQLAV